jgi:hypothetical protein
MELMKHLFEQSKKNDSKSENNFVREKSPPSLVVNYFLYLCIVFGSNPAIHMPENQPHKISTHHEKRQTGF